MLTISRPVTN